MDQGRFDEIAVAVSDGQTRRSVLGRGFGGSLAALLAAAGLGAGDEEADARSRCARKCKRKNSKKARRKCRQRCQRKAEGNDLELTGEAALTPQSGANCAELDECVDAVNGTLSGAPIADGTFAGTLTGTNINASDPAAVTSDYTGTLTAEETETGDTLIVDVVIQLTLNAVAGTFAFTGTYEITGGTGRFDGASGTGVVSGSGTRPGGIGAAGDVDAFTMQGDIDLA